MHSLISKNIILFGLIFYFLPINAHNPNTSSVMLFKTNGLWTVRYTISQEGANYALDTFYDKINLNNISTDDYKKLYIDYLKTHTNIIVDHKKINLGLGGIRLGNHQTDVNLLIPSFPDEYETVELTVNVFSENKNQNTVLKFIDGDKKIRKVLNSNNHYSIVFKNTPNGYKIISTTKKNDFWYYLIPLFLIFALVLFFLKNNL